MHSKDIIHRDLKSLNVFLTKDNSCKVGDLGNAKKLPPEFKVSTQKNNKLSQIDEFSEADKSELEDESPPQKVGTPFYLAPELWQNKPCSKKSDIWSLGVILYEMTA